MTDTSRLTWATSLFYFGQLAGSYLLTYALQRFDSRYGFAQVKGPLQPWQYIYIFAGALTFLFGILCFFIPNSPSNAWFLTLEERIVAVERLRSGQTGIKQNKLKFSQNKEGLLDINVNGCRIHRQRRRVRLRSTDRINLRLLILFQFPIGGVSGVGTVLIGWLCSKIKNIRIILLSLCCLPVIAGFAMIWKSTWGAKPVTPVAGYSLLGFFGPVVGLTISLGSANVAGHTKRSFNAAAVFIAYCVGNIIGPRLIRSQTKAQHYPELWTGLIICYCIVILTSSVLYFLWSRENKRRASLDLDEAERERLGFKDLTDKENLNFQYVY
ncbi:MFS general substrate transporter [Aspergillus affinis]|uniref:MFS general substrate transporter n=1 Tax=Aspergillus affinis TaxID=1070780 RepID=UPI0022FE2C03|nr:MFS general substrate transporter [Aspergillus affinis]KAI9035891.1 MFS general substrate transporter [Aspergillus affinis]